MKRTKIVATIGPASVSVSMIQRLISAGVDVARLNFSHDAGNELSTITANLRAEAKRQGLHIGILGDLQGPKIRIAGFAENAIQLSEGSRFVIDPNVPTDGGDLAAVGVAYPQLADDLKADDILLLDDGRIVLKVTKICGQAVHTTVVTGGELSSNKGINRKGGGLSAEALTDKDRHDIVLAADLAVDYLAVSFPRCAADIELARELAHLAGSQAGIIAKIERAEALTAIDEIIAASDGIMIARGDLGVEVGDASLPAIQSMLIKKARDANRTVITATQMMESMIHNSIPTRAEVFDVANAVLSGSDAVMLSAETAVGRYPDLAVEAMSRISEHAERQKRASRSSHRIDSEFKRIDEAIAMAAMYIANHLDLRAIVALTETGSTALWMSRISSSIPIYGLTRNPRIPGRMTLFRGVTPLFFSDSKEPKEGSMMPHVFSLLLQHKMVNHGDNILFTRGDLFGESGRTNTLKIVSIP